MAIKRVSADRTSFDIPPNAGSVDFKLVVEGDRGTVWYLEVKNGSPFPVEVTVGGCTARIGAGESYNFPDKAAGVVCYPSPLPGSRVEVSVSVRDPDGWNAGGEYRLVFTPYWVETGGVSCPAEPLGNPLPLFWTVLGGGRATPSKRCVQFIVVSGDPYWVYVEPVGDRYARYIGIFAGEVDDNEFWKHPSRYRVIKFETVTTKKLYKITAPTSTLSVCISTGVGYWKVCLYGKPP